MRWREARGVSSQRRRRGGGGPGVSRGEEVDRGIGGMGREGIRGVGVAMGEREGEMLWHEDMRRIDGW
jgi:hypothetical protein